jgi:hypothetical protein
MVRRGYEYNNPLDVILLNCTGDVAEVGILESSVASVIITGVYPFRDGFIIRCY